MQCFDELEQRQLLAGDVTVVVSGADLVVQGDVFANDLQLYTRSENGGTELVVQGLAGTTVNGSNELFVVVAAESFQTVVVHLGAGDDSLDVDGLSGLGGLDSRGVVILGAAGNDRLSIADVDLAGKSLTVFGGTNNPGNPADGMLRNDGDDLMSFGLRRGKFNVDKLIVTDWHGSNSIYMTEVVTATKTAVDLIDYQVNSTNTNVVSIGRSQLTQLDIGVTGSSTDTILVYSSTMERGAHVSTSSADDDVAIHNSSLGSLSATGHEGGDAINVYECTLTGSIYFTDAASEHSGKIDRYGLYNVTVGQVTVFALPFASGDDVFVAQGLSLAGSLNELDVGLADGNDTVIMLDGSTSGAVEYSGPPRNYRIDMGDGNDVVSLNNMRFEGRIVTYDGGRGNDVLSIGNRSDLGVGLRAVDRWGDNGFFLSDLAIARGGLSIEAAGSNTNTFYMANITLGTGGGLAYAGGIGSDTLLFLDGTLFTAFIDTADVVISTGGGDDSISFRNAIFNNAGMYAGTPASGDRTFLVELGDGDDSLEVMNTKFAVQGVFRFDGGAGANTATASGSVSTRAPEVVNLGSFTLPPTV